MTRSTIRSLRASMLLPTALAAIVAAALVSTDEPAAAAGDAGLKELMGTYVGRATMRDHPGGKTEEREIDVEVTPFKGDGFRIRWVNVTLIDGQRDRPGVKRRVSEVTFKAGTAKGFFVEAPESSVFSEREEVAAMGGDPIRWAVLDAAGLHLYAFILLKDGRYELQTYTRRRTAEGIDLHYERVVDGERLRTIDGRAVKAE